MKKLFVPLEYLLAIAILTAFWVAVTAAMLLWLGSGHGLFAVGQNLSGSATAWVALVLFGYGWLMTVCAVIFFGPRKMLEMFLDELSPGL